MIQERDPILKKKNIQTNLKIKFEITDMLAAMKSLINTKKNLSESRTKTQRNGKQLRKRQENKRIKPVGPNIQLTVADNREKDEKEIIKERV